MKTAIAFLLMSCLASAANLSPVGTWKTIDDASGAPRAIVEIFLQETELKGKILKTFPEPGDTGICDKCEGEKRGKPVVGMEIIWGMKENDGEWSGGHILDPKNGKVYKAKLQVTQDGQKLKVRGYIGFSLLGRTQVWLRNQD